MLIQNKYHKWYYAIIDRARNRKSVSGYSESHHIIPKSMGGSDAPDNRVTLSAREHYVAHLCLTKCTVGKDRFRMLLAIGNFRRGSGEQRVVYRSMQMNGRLYEQLRRRVSTLVSQRNLAHNPMSDPSTRQRVIEHLRMRNQIPNAVARNKQSRSLKRHYLTHDNPMQGRHHSEETKAKMRLARLMNPTRCGGRRKTVPLQVIG